MANPFLDDTDTPDDAALAKLIEDYCQKRESDAFVSREAFLAEHLTFLEANPQLATRLADCLDGLELVDGKSNWLADTCAISATDVSTERPKNVSHQIGDFDILGELGRGGMGVVYKARERKLDRIVALKVMRFGIVDPKALERFQREAETAGALHHTNIVPVYATGREGDTSWYAMQCIEGESLLHRIEHAYGHEKGGPIQVDEIVDIGIQAAEALHHAHQREVIHRDVKPANLIIDHQHRVWLTDFGLARRLVDVGATVTGAMLGTPRYMSPEQADVRSNTVDHRSDIYSLGATLYELATGRPPVEGDDPFQVIRCIRHEEPPRLDAVRSDLPRDLSVVIGKCMEKQPVQRYATALEFADDLRAIREDRSIRARPPSLLERAARWSRKHHHRVRAAIVTSIFTVLAMISVLFLLNDYHRRNQGSFRLRAAGGPFATSIRPAGPTMYDANPIELTVPMQESAKVPLGDYDALLAPHGWSHRVRIPVQAEGANEYRVYKRPNTTGYIPLENAIVIPVRDFESPAALRISNNILERISAPPPEPKSDNTSRTQPDWSLDIRQVRSKLTRLDGNPSAEDQPASLEVNFALPPGRFNAPAEVQLLVNPGFARPDLTVRTPMDLDGDMRADTILAAADSPSLLAIDANGQVLWSRVYDLTGTRTEGNPQLKNHSQRDSFLLPGVISLIDAGDLDGDQIHDVLATFVEIMPGVRTEVAIVTLSGGTGAVLNVVRRRPLSLANGTSWPPEGTLKIGNAPSLRAPRVFFKSARQRGNNYNHSDQIQFAPGSSSQRFAIPSPLQLVHTENGSLVTYVEGDKCQWFELVGLKPLGPELRLPFLVGSPRVVQIGAGRVGFAFRPFHDPHQNPSTNPTALVTYALNGEKMFERPANSLGIQYEEQPSSPNLSDLPLATDLNGDGKSELVMSLRNSKQLGLVLLDASTGESIWSRQRFQISDSVGDSLERLTTTKDIDGDGWRDLATATICGPTGLDLHALRNGSKAIPSVYINWISGRTGAPLAWASHPFPVVSNHIVVADIDAIRSDLLDQPAGAIEVDIVAGESNSEISLESAVVRFYPSSPQAISIASGLTQCADALNSPSRLFLKRSGALLEHQTQLEFVPDPNPPQMQRLGDNSPIDFWKEVDGSHLVALRSEMSLSMSVVNCKDGLTRWTLPPGNIIPLKRLDGTTDLMNFWSDGKNRWLRLLDGSSGRELWTTRSVDLDQVFYARVLKSAKHGEVLLTLRPTAWVLGARGVQRSDAFQMSMAKISNGEALWTRDYLHRAPIHNRPGGFNDIEFHDLNADGEIDLIGPDQDEGGEESPLCLRAIDGLTGKTLWTREVFGPPGYRAGWHSGYYAGPVLTLERGGHALFAAIQLDGDSNKQPMPYQLGLYDATTGAQLFTYSLPDLMSRNSSWDRSQTMIAAMCELQKDRSAVGNSEGDFAIAYLDGHQDVQCKTFRIEGTNLVELKSVKLNRDGAARNARHVWLKPTAPGTNPSLLVEWNRPNESGVNELSCFPILEDRPSWSLLLPGVEKGGPFVWQRFDGKEWLMIPGTNKGEVIDPLDGRRVGTYEGERPTITDATLVGGDWRLQLLTTNSEGAVFTEVGRSKVGSNDPVDIHSVPDPRHLWPIFEEPTEVLWDEARKALKASLALIATVLLPGWYLTKGIRSRNFSLRWLLGAPALVMFALVVGRYTSILTDWKEILQYGVVSLASISAIVSIGSSMKRPRSRYSRLKMGLFACAIGILMAILWKEALDMMRWQSRAFGTNFAGAEFFLQPVFTWRSMGMLLILVIGYTGVPYWIGRLAIVFYTQTIRLGQRLRTRKEIPIHGQ